MHIKHSFVLLLTTMLCLAGLSGKSQTTWKTYDHPNGFTLQLPDYFREGLLVAGGSLQWYPADMDHDIGVSVEMWGNGTQAELLSSYEQDIKSYPRTVYKTIKPGWYVMSGHLTDGIEFIFYNKTIIKNGVQYHLRIRYPVDQKKRFDDILGKISASFK